MAGALDGRGLVALDHVGLMAVCLAAPAPVHQGPIHRPNPHQPVATPRLLGCMLAGGASERLAFELREAGPGPAVRDPGY